MPQSLHSNTDLEPRRRRCFLTKLLPESSCNDFITRFPRTALQSARMHTTQYPGSLPSFCMISCSHIETLLIKSARRLDLISDLEPLGCVRRSECSKKSVTRFVRNCL